MQDERQDLVVFAYYSGDNPTPLSLGLYVEHSIDIEVGKDYFFYNTETNTVDSHTVDNLSKGYKKGVKYICASSNIEGADKESQPLSESHKTVKDLIQYCEGIAVSRTEYKDDIFKGVLRKIKAF